MRNKGWIAGLVLSIVLPVHAADRLPDLARDGDVPGVKRLLSQKADVNAAGGDGMTALHWAASEQNLEIARLLVAAGADVNRETRLQHMTPLHLAAAAGNRELAELLIEAKADVNAVNDLGTTPLMQAAASGDVNLIEALLGHGAAVDAREIARGQTALMFAAGLDRAEAVRLLAAHGADLDATSKVTMAKPELVDEDGNALPENSRKPKTEGTGMGGLTALHYAAREGFLDTARALLEAGANVNQPSPLDNGTALILALSNGHFDLADYLLSKGADPNIANADGLAAVYALIESRWSPVAWTPNAFTSASGIVQQKTAYLDLLGALLDRGADPNAKIAKTLWFSPPHHNAAWVKAAGTTPFWRAAQANDIPAMKLLLSRGADPKIASDENTAALAVAAGIGWAGNYSTNAPDAFLPAVRFLVEELGFDVNAADNSGYTPLMGAAYRGDNEMVRYLVEKGARLDARTRREWSVTDMANGPYLRSSFPVPHPDTVALLRSMGAPGLTPTDDEEILGVIKKKPAASEAPAAETAK